MNGAIRAGSILGIPFYLHPSWFLILALVTFSYGSGIGTQFPQLTGIIPWALGFFAALLLFTSVLLHELGHSVVARSQGIPVRSITLFLFGGLANLEDESRTPAESFWVAVAGPLVSLTLFGIFFTISATTGITGPLAAIIDLLASINLILAVFNMLPGLPLDGGNVVKAVVWKFTDNLYKGVAWAGRAGQVFGGLAVAWGALPFVLYGSFANVWFLIIGWFLITNAGRAVQTARLQERLSQLTAEDALLPDGPVVSEDITVREFIDQQLVSAQGNWERFWVVDSSGHLSGLIRPEDLQRTDRDQWDSVLLGQIVQPYDEKGAIEPSRSLLDVTKLLEKRNITEIPVMQNHVLLGLLRKSSIQQLLRRAQAQANPA